MDLHIDTLVERTPVIESELLRWQGGVRGEPGERVDMSEDNIASFTSAMLTQGCTVAGLVGADQSARLVASAVSTAREEMSREVDAARSAICSLLQGDDSPVARALRDVMQTEGLRIEQAFDPTRERGALHVLHQQMSDLTAAVQRDQGRREANAKTTRKGFDFESQVVEALFEVTNGLGFDAVATGTTTGSLPTSKKGDAVVTATSGVRIVVEVSDSQQRDWTTYLTEAERNRDADTSLAVVRHPEQNNGVTVRMIGARRMCMVYDPDVDEVDTLRTAITVLSALPASGGTDVDLSAVRAAVERVSASLTRCGEMARTAAVIRKQAAKMESLASELREESQRAVEEALSTLG